MSDQVNARGLAILNLLDDEFNFEASVGDMPEYRTRSLSADQSMVGEIRADAIQAFWHEAAAINRNIHQINTGETRELHYLSANDGAQLISRLTPQTIEGTERGGNRHTFNQEAADKWIQNTLKIAHEDKPYVANALRSMTKALGREINDALSEEGQKRLKSRQPSMTLQEIDNTVFHVLQKEHGMTDAEADFYLFIVEMHRTLDPNPKGVK